MEKLSVLVLLHLLLEFCWKLFFWVDLRTHIEVAAAKVPLINEAQS